LRRSWRRLMMTRAGHFQIAFGERARVRDASLRSCNVARRRGAPRSQSAQPASRSGSSKSEIFAELLELRSVVIGGPCAFKSRARFVWRKRRVDKCLR
jgi:hypothetical protein